MSIPTYDVFIPTLLRVLAAHPEGLRSRDAQEEVGNAVGLSEEDRAMLLPSGGQAIYQNRIGWAHDRLKRAGYSQSLRRGYWQLTDSGRAFAAAHPDGMDQKTVDALALIPKTSKVSDGLDASRKLEPTRAPVAEPQGPEERIDDAIAELNESLARDLLAQIGEASPAFFEKLVLDLLLAMGYGASRAALQPVGGSGDGGIDGIVALDRLGLEKVYVQAKRWKGSVGRPEIQELLRCARWTACAQGRLHHDVELHQGGEGACAERLGQHRAGRWDDARDADDRSPRRRNAQGSADRAV